jgi:hypothetical protein
MKMRYFISKFLMPALLLLFSQFAYPGSVCHGKLLVFALVYTHAGISPQRMGTISRSPIALTITGTVSVGAILQDLSN